MSLNLYTVLFEEAYPGHPDSLKETRITVATDTETKAIERATREYQSVVEYTALYTMGGRFTTEVVYMQPIFDGLIVEVDEGP